MATLSATHSFYVRCIKPNSRQVCSDFDSDMVLAQLRYTGMLDTIRIRMLGYPIRWPIDDFFKRYNILVPGIKVIKNDPKSNTRTLLEKLEANKDNIQLGKTKVFLRDKEYASLESRRNKKIEKQIIVIQSWWKMILAKKVYRIIKKAVILIQRIYRGYSKRKKFLRLKSAIITFQSICKMIQQRKSSLTKLLAKRKRDEEERKRKEEEERKRKLEERKRKEEEERKRREEEEKKKRKKKKKEKEKKKKIKNIKQKKNEKKKERMNYEKK